MNNTGIKENTFFINMNSVRHIYILHEKVVFPLKVDDFLYYKESNGQNTIDN